MQKPKFSIIVPVYNVEKFVARTLESAINQNYKDIEIICVDDCGQDKSVDIVKEFAKKDKRIKIIHNKENLKLYLARANGVRHAQGDYILNLDSDDYLHPDTCLKCYELLEKNGKFDFIMFNLLRQDKDNGEFKLIKVIDKTQIIDDVAFEALYFGKDTNFYNVATKCIKKATYLKALEFANVTRKITIAEDILASMALLGVSKRIALLDEGLYYYAYNENSAMRAEKLEKVQEKIENLEYVIAQCEGFMGRKDERYNAFICALIINLRFHILGNESYIIHAEYQRCIFERKYLRYLARFVLSFKKKAIQRKQRTLNYELSKLMQRKGDIFGL